MVKETKRNKAEEKRRCEGKVRKMSRIKAHVLGEHGTHHKVFLIRGGRVIKERGTNMYLKYGWKKLTALGYWNGKFQWK